MLSATLDDHAKAPGQPAWDYQLVDDVQVRLQQLAGVPLTIANISTFPSDEESRKQLIPALESIEALICVVSPAFLRAENCQQLLEDFSQAAEGSG